MRAVWLEQWEECVGDDFEEAQQLSKPQDKSVQTVESSPAIAAFQVQIRTRPRRPHNFAGDLCAFALGFLLAGSVLLQQNLYAAATCCKQDSKLVQVWMPSVPSKQWAALMHAYAVFSQTSAYLNERAALPCAMLYALTIGTSKTCFVRRFCHCPMWHVCMAPLFCCIVICI